MTDPLVFHSRSPAETGELARALAGLARPGDLIVLAGDLGAGKTTFTKAFAAALGVTAPVTSPTFTLANRYEGDLVVHHLDVYRLEGLAEVSDLALEELLDDDAVTLVEWGDTIAPALPEGRLEVVLTLADPDEAEDERIVTLQGRGPGWADRLADLADDAPLPGLGADHRC